ncbi:DUF7144 family membrane protein [Nocardioides sp. Soil805]|uniref:DUF7144 family membrane protein n=1 Tax=Nocardioides sp. Soil805 TaxID=1736416 RepID=UPI00070336CE|nr:hypothetical protein [Nocardioides sp. Soil805]KRF34136.1 hypothetical protein ASG94_15490 [Nocardioides sp. Soil805]
MATAPTTPSTEQDEDQPSRFWNGMIAFAAFMLLLIGGFHFLGGLVGMLEDDQYLVGDSELLIQTNYRAWGVAHMLIAVLMWATAYGLFWRKTWARSVAVGIAALSLLTNVAFLAANPWWFTTMIVMDLLVIYAVTVHGGVEEIA